MPKRNRAVQYDKNGDLDVLVLRELPIPEPEVGNVRVRVRVAGLNPFDSKVRTGDGRYRLELPFPRGIGCDFAGVVDSVAPDTTYFDGALIEEGDEVLGWADLRSVADYVIVRADELVRKPPGLTWPLAGALQTPARTAAASLELLGIGKGDVLLVGACAGGVGTMLAQLAIARGAQVVGTASADNASFLRELGVLPVTYGPGLVARIRATGLRPTAAVDAHGREVVDAALELGLAPSRVQTLVLHDVTEQLGLATPGFSKRTPGVLAAVAHAVVAGGITVPVKSYPIESVREAFHELEQGHVRGKIVIAVDGAID